tara:strand:+ start:153 stop:551 length:399 start_codon:yes stop_codon:yes gene_type:complete
MYHEYPYKAQIPVLIEGKYTTRTFTSNDDVWDVIRLIIDETKEENKKGRSFNIASSVMAQLPFFACTNTIIDDNAQKDIARFMYARQFKISPYQGSYGEQPKKWVEKSFLLTNVIETAKAKAIKDGGKYSKN